MGVFSRVVYIMTSCTGSFTLFSIIKHASLPPITHLAELNNLFAKFTNMLQKSIKVNNNEQKKSFQLLSFEVGPIQLPLSLSNADDVASHFSALFHYNLSFCTMVKIFSRSLEGQRNSNKWHLRNFSILK